MSDLPFSSVSNLDVSGKNNLINNQNYNIKIKDLTKSFNTQNNQPFYLGLEKEEIYPIETQSTEKFFDFSDTNEFNVLSSNSYTDVSNLSIDFSENEPQLDIYNQVNEEISLTYVLDNISTPSGLSAVNMKELKAFTIDFDTFRTGEVTSSGEMPFINYKKYILSGEGCPPKQEVIDNIQDINPCSKSFTCAICSSALKIRSTNPSQTFIDVPKQSMLFGIYGNLVDYIFTNSEVGMDNYRITLNDKLFSLCCQCKEEGIECKNELEGLGGGGGDDQKCPENNLFKIPEDTNENTINQQYGLYFLDAINLKSIKENYGKNAFYSGEIINPNKFIDGDKIQFNQYSYQFEEVHKKLYGFDPIYKAVNTEFIYSSTTTGDEYFFTASELVDKINLKFNSTGIYSWIPMLYNKYPRYSYGPLLSGKLENDSKISLISLKSGKLGEHAINLDLGPRSVIVSYLLPKVIELQGSNDGLNWGTIISSKNIQPVNILKTNPDAVGGRIKYEEIDNTKVIRELSLPVGSTTGIRIIPSGENATSGSLADLIDQIESGNKQFATGNGATIVCIPSSSGKLSKICGSGYLELYIPSGCPIPRTGITGIKEEEEEEEGQGEKEGFKTKKIKIEDNVYRIGFVNYLE